jgi:hypothetical protein
MFASLKTTPMQLGLGDLLVDTEGQAEWFTGRGIINSSLGIRLGEALRGNTAWGGLTVTWPVLVDAWATELSYGPIHPEPSVWDTRVCVATSEGRPPAFRRPPPPRPPPPPRTPDFPSRSGWPWSPARARFHQYPGDQGVGAGCAGRGNHGGLRGLAAGPAIRQPNGEWQGYYRISPGLHRVNVRIDGAELDAPENWPREKDEFLGTVALVHVR